ncbi:MAG: low molecular weight phosphotyrosine protein phosphatase [Bacteroidales bacterium]|nr:low molecular weight phosphotyrosine protein phosphatase [Bacteroidales bacterium]
MKKILFISLGNICRSPLAEGILNNKIEKSNKKAIIESAGFESFNINEPPQKRAIKFAKKKGINISEMRCRLFTAEDFDIFDEIYVMDSGSFRECQYFSRNEKDMKKVKYLMDVASKPNKTVPNPNYLSEGGLEKTYQMLDEACEIISNSI